MKKTLFRKIGIGFAVIIIIGIYINSSLYIERKDWKYVDGVYIGDWLGKNSFIIDERLILTNQGKAKVIFCTGKELIIKDLEGSEKGYYVCKN